MREINAAGVEPAKPIGRLIFSRMCLPISRCNSHNDYHRLLGLEESNLYIKDQNLA